MKRFRFMQGQEGRPGGPSLPLVPFESSGRLGEPSLPFSQAEDSTQTSGFENRLPGTARPRVRIREHRPGFTV